MATRAVRGASEAPVGRELIRLARNHSSILDLALGVLLAAVIVLDAATGARGQPTAGTAILVVGALAVGWRRRYPTAVAVISIGAYLADHLLTRHVGPGQPAVLISLYTLASQRPRKLALWAVLAASAAVLLGQSAHGAPRGAEMVVAVLGVLASTMIGLLIADRRREQERERRLLAESAVAEERVRIARELHDVVAHHLSVIVVQANVLAEAARTGDTEEASARAIVDVGRRALAEMRRILGVLRPIQDDDVGMRAPQPGLAELGALVDTVRNTGLKLEVQIEGAEHPLPEALDLSAYRILQEALTNVLRHARATRASVRITYTPSALELRITDDGIGASAEDGQDQGHGLAGMRERTLMFGGEFSAGPANGKGYAIRAVLPL